MAFSKLTRFYQQLRRRHVLRTSAIYIATAWVLIQVADTTFPIFDLPDEFTRYVTIGLAAGFPVVVVLSWVFDIVRGPAPGPVEIPAQASPKPTEYTVSASVPPDRSIAVLAFANVSNDPDNDYFSNGIAEELLNLLSTLPDLKVAARTSAFFFKDKDEDVRVIAERLGVRHVLEGSVRRVTDRVRITAQLVDASTGFQLWSNRYDRELDDIFAVQDEIAASIVYALNDTLDEYHSAEAPLREHSPTDNIEAYQLYLRGLYLWQRRGETAIRGAIGALNEALELDPQFTDAMTLLAVSQAALHEYSGEDREIGFAIAEPLARKAMELDPTSSKPLAVLGYIAVRRWDWANADKWFARALALGAAEPLVHQWYSNVLNDLGYREKALTHAMTAYQIDRLSPQANNTLALCFLMLERDVEALKHIAVAREFGLGSPVPDYVEYLICVRKQEFERAASVMDALLARRKANTDWVAPVISALASEPNKPAAVAALTQACKDEAISPSLAFMQYVLLQQADEVFEMADTQLEDHSLIHLWLLMPCAAALRDDPRFLSLMTRMGIVEHWQKMGWPPLAEALRANT